ncbi:MAG: HYR domain-containing protein, partial [Verrucomicrobia bacterium]|nr:HYR domain-containing protein [Verrucomicrobiota bacterium]
TLSANTWSLVTGTYDGANLRVYVNGALDGTLPASVTMADNGLGVRLGARQFSTALPFPGLLDEARIYNRVLTQTEVQALLNPFATTRTLTINSVNPNSGASVTVSPNDNNNQGNGTTAFTRIYNDGASVNLTAPATAGGNNFSKWQRDGVDWAVTPATSVTMAANHTMTAIYASTLSIVCPANTGASAAIGQCSAVVNYPAPIVSGGTGGVTVVCNPPSGANFPVGITTVNCTATDSVNATASCSFTVTVLDTQPPVITCPTPLFVPSDLGQCYASGVALGAPVVNDNCGVASVVSNAPAQFLVGVTTVTWTATDVHGNTATCTQSVTVPDQQPPVIICPANITVAAPPGQCSSNVVFAVSATDNCPGVFVATVPSSGFAFPIGTTTVTSTATDLSGNASSCTFTVTVTGTCDPTLVANWKLDDASGLSALDSSGNGNTGSLVNGPLWSAGASSGALSFDGVNDYVDAGNGASLNPTTAITLVAWVKASSTAATGGLIVKDNATTHQYALWLQAGGKVRLVIGAAVLTGTTTVTTGVWHQLAGTYDGTQLKIYLDGALEGTLAASGTMSNNGVNARLGGRAFTTPLTLNGALDAARIYNRALSQSEIQALTP